MTSTPASAPGTGDAGDPVVHPLLAAVGVVRTALAEVRTVQPLFLPVEAKGDLLAELAAAKAQLEELELRVLATCGDAAAATGARDIGAWLSATLPVEGRTARAVTRLAVAVEGWPQVAEALAEGRLTLDQARVIITALDAAAPMMTTDQAADAEALMITEAQRLDPGRLRILGKRLLALVGAEDGAAADAALLAAAEKSADKRARLWMRPRGDGMTRIEALVPDATAHRLRVCLEAFAQPRRTAYEADGKRLPYPKLLADALRDLLERIDPAVLPHHGGDATTVFVTMSLDQLRDELATAGLGFDGETITASQARRLACTAGIIPVVLGGESEILDLGRKSRLHTPIMRKAMRLRDRQCRAEGCDVPASWWLLGFGTGVGRAGSRAGPGRARQGAAGVSR